MNVSVHFFCVLALAGCAERTLAALVPKLDVQLRLRRHHATAGENGRGRSDVVLGAQLRWRPSWGDTGDPATSELAQLISCDVTDVGCLAARFAAEPELAGLVEAR
jgi:hypothetical protein